MCLMTTAATNFTFFQASNVEEPRLRGKLPDQAAGAEGRAGVREGEGVRRPGQAPGGDTSNTSIELDSKP